MKYYTLHRNSLDTCPGGVEQTIRYLSDWLSDLSVTELRFDQLNPALITPDSTWIVDSYMFPPELIQRGAHVVSIIHGLMDYLVHCEGITDPENPMKKMATAQSAALRTLHAQSERYTGKFKTVACSKSTNDSMMRFLGFAADETINNPADTYTFSPGQRQKQPDFSKPIHITGRFAGKHKGGELIVKIMEALPDTYKIIPMQNIHPLQRPSFYQAMDIYLSLSTFEGCSMVLNEALATGLPIISCMSGLLEDVELITPYNLGIIYDRVLHTRDTYADTIIGYIHNIVENLQRGARYQGREFAEKHLNLPAWAEQWRKFLTVDLFI